MKQVDPKKRVKAGLAVITLLVLIQFGLLPFNRWQQETQERIIQVHSEMTEKKKLISQAEQIKSALTEAEAAFKKVEALYFQKITNPETLQLRLQESLETIAQKEQVKLTSSDWLHSTTDGAIRAPIKVRYKASPEHLLGFLNALENDPHFLSIDHLEIRTLPKKQLLQGTITISAYGLKEKI